MPWKAVTVKVPNISKFMRVIDSDIDKTVELPKKDLEEFVSTFRAKNKPTIRIKVERKKDYRAAFTGVESTWERGRKANKNDKLMFLARGTRVRYATMSSTFQAKTTPGSISTRNVRGNRDPILVSTRSPKPGIESRDLEMTIKKKRKRAVEKELEKLVIKAALASRK